MDRSDPAGTAADGAAPDAAAAAAVERGRLRWRCRRGMRELDELLTRYVERHYATASAAEQAAFRRLLDCHDPLLHAWFLGRESPSDPVLSNLIERITAGAGTG